MSRLKRQLPPNEKLIFEAQRHWVRYAKPVMLSCLGILVLALLVGFQDRLPSEVKSMIKYAYFAAAGVVALGLLGLLYRKFRDGYYEMVVTEDNIINTSGVIRHETNSLGLQSVEYVKVEQGFWGRILGYGTIKIIAQGSTVASYISVRKPIEFRNKVISTRDRSST